MELFPELKQKEKKLEGIIQEFQFTATYCSFGSCPLALLRLRQHTIIRIAADRSVVIACEHADLRRRQQMKVNQFQQGFRRDDLRNSSVLSG